MSTQPMTDPYASIAKPIDPYASLAKPSTIPSQPTDTRNGIQRAVDTAATPDTDATRQQRVQRAQGLFGQTAGKVAGGIENFGNDVTQGITKGLVQPLAHPVDTGKSLLKSGAANAANFVDPTGHAAHAAGLPSFMDQGKSLASGVKGIPAAIHEQGGLMHAVPSAVGVGIGTTALGELLGATMKLGGMVRTAAIGDTDAAALRGLQVGPKSDAQLSKLSSVSKARPYLAGAQSQADMQGRLKPAMDEVWNPYSTGVQAIGNRQVMGPDGMTTVQELENERLRLSALNRGVKSGNPSDIQQAIQEGRTPAQLIAREKQVQGMLDPHLASTGIKPGAIRDTYGALADVRNGVEGKTTLNEKPQPSGIGRMMNLDISRPKSFIGEPLQGARDLIAGRPLWSANPTDLGIREGFATGGPKPDLGTLQPPNLSASTPHGLPAPATQLGAPLSPGGTPPGFRPPPFYHDTTAMRTGRLLPPPPIQLGGAVEGPKGTPFRYDTTPMRQGRLLDAPLKGDELPSSYHTDAFPDQLPSGVRVRPKTIEGKK